MCLLLPFPHPVLRMQSTGRLQLFRELSQCVFVCFSVCVFISLAEILMQHCASGSQDYVLKSRLFITGTLVDILPENCSDTLRVQGRMWPRMSISINVFIQHAYHNMKGILYVSQCPCTVDTCPGYVRFCVSLKKDSLAKFFFKNPYSHMLTSTAGLISK